jgi:ribonuclease R
MCLSGERSGTKYSIGDVLEVSVAAVNLDEKKIDLVLSGEKSSASHIKLSGKTKSKSTGLRKNSDNGFNTSRKASDKEKSKDKPKKAKDKKTDKSKAKKRTARKKRPGKNARKTAE